MSVKCCLIQVDIPNVFILQNKMFQPLISTSLYFTLVPEHLNILILLWTVLIVLGSTERGVNQVPSDMAQKTKNK